MLRRTENARENRDGMMVVVTVVVVVMVVMVIVAVIAAMAMMMGIMIGSGITSMADSRRSNMVIASNGAVGSEALILIRKRSININKDGTFLAIISAMGSGGLGKAQLWRRRRSYFSKAQPLCCA